MNRDEPNKWWPFALNIVIIILVFYLLIGKNLHSSRPPDLQSYAFTTFVGHLFFILLPVEVIFIYYASEGQTNVIILVALTLVLAMISQSLDYYIGHSVRKSFLTKFISLSRIERAKKILERYGTIMIFVFNLLPISSPILIMVSGVLNYSFRTVFTYSLLGLFFKYLIISFLFL